MSDSLFGKQGQPKIITTEEPKSEAPQSDDQPTMDFWSSEAHKPDPPKPVADAIVETPPQQSVEGALPGANELLKPFESSRQNHNCCKHDFFYH